MSQHLALKIDTDLLKRDILTDQDAREVGEAIVGGLTPEEIMMCWKSHSDPLKFLIDKRRDEVKQIVFEGIEEAERAIRRKAL